MKHVATPQKIYKTLEDLVKSDAAAAVQSIPAYVEAANLFVALVPSLKHREILGSVDEGRPKG